MAVVLVPSAPACKNSVQCYGLALNYVSLLSVIAELLLEFLNRLQAANLAKQKERVTLGKRA